MWLSFGDCLGIFDPANVIGKKVFEAFVLYFLFKTGNKICQKTNRNQYQRKRRKLKRAKKREKETGKKRERERERERESERERSTVKVRKQKGKVNGNYQNDLNKIF